MYEMLEAVNKEINKLAVHGVFDCERVRNLYDASNRLRRELISSSNPQKYRSAIADHFSKESLPEGCDGLLAQCLENGDTVEEACYKLLREYYPSEAEVSLNR